jgi:hypothetical protein
MEVKDNVFTVIFTDYGNIDTLSKNDIRPLPEALKLPIYLNHGKVEDVEKSKKIIVQQLSETEVFIKPKRIVKTDEHYSLIF